MEKAISLKDITKEFKILNRREGLRGSFLDLFSRDYKIIKAVDRVSLNIERGEIVGYLGPNGAGKSTTIKIMTGILEPTRGEILINGRVPHQQRTRVAQEIGVVFGQRSQLWWALPVIESFHILKDIYQVSDKEYKDMIDLYATLIKLDDIIHKPVRQLSLGQRTLSDILAAFLHNPKIVFLDEPTIGLDISMKSKIQELIAILNKEKKTTIVLTTHDMGDVDALCKRIVIIDKGALLYDNDSASLKRYFGAYRTLKLRLANEAEQLTEETLERQSAVVQEKLRRDHPSASSLIVTRKDSWLDVLINEDETPLMEILKTIQSNYQIFDMKLEEISTESVIKKIYEGGIE